MGEISSFGFIDGLPLGLGYNPKIPSSKYRFCHAAIRLGLSKLNNSGLNIKYSDDTFQSIWHKAGLNCVLNTYCTLIDCNINQYGSFDKNLELTRAVLNEVTAVGKAEGINVKQDVIEKNIKNLFPLETAGAHYPSLYQDMKNGRLTEIDYLNGEISRLGKIHNIPTPVCDIITLMIHSKEFINNNK